MRDLSFSLLLLLIAGWCLLSSCKKNSTPANPTLLEHKWQVVSINGEAMRYVGQANDYFNFSNNTLVEFLGGHYDTLTYQLTNGGQTLDLSPIVNNSQTGYKFSLNILTLTDSRLILSGGLSMPVLHILDSLSR